MAPRVSLSILTPASIILPTISRDSSEIGILAAERAFDAISSELRLVYKGARVSWASLAPFTENVTIWPSLRAILPSSLAFISFPFMLIVALLPSTDDILPVIV